MVQSDPHTRAKGPEHIAAYSWMQDYAAKVIAERRANPQNDLISHFSTAEIDGDKLDEREVLLTTTTLIMAGIESLGGFMSMLAYNLVDHPEARRAVVANPALLADAVEQSLRFNTSAQRFRRWLQEDVTQQGQTMRTGDFVCLATPRPIATNASSPTPTCTTSRAGRAAISASAAASTPASARRSPAWRSRSRSRNSTRSCRTTAGCRSNWPGCRPPPSAARWCCSSRCNERRLVRVRSAASSLPARGRAVRRIIHWHVPVVL